MTLTQFKLYILVYTSVQCERLAIRNMSLKNGLANTHFLKNGLANTYFLNTYSVFFRTVGLPTKYTSRLT